MCSYVQEWYSRNSDIKINLWSNLSLIWMKWYLLIFNFLIQIKYKQVNF
jgi:hypothetical protein